jgi:hypothetical protein
VPRATDLAVVDNGDAVAVLGLLHGVGGNDDGDARVSWRRPNCAQSDDPAVAIASMHKELSLPWFTGIGRGPTG